MEKIGYEFCAGCDNYISGACTILGQYRINKNTGNQVCESAIILGKPVVMTERHIEYKNVKFDRPTNDGLSRTLNVVIKHFFK